MTHTWKVTDLSRAVDSGLIHRINYRLESQHNELEARKNYELNITGSVSDEGFVTYDSLDEATVLTWLSSSIDQTALETQNSQSISENEAALLLSANQGSGTPWSI